MSTLLELKKQKEAIEAKIAEAQKAERSEAINKIKELVNAFELSEKDIFGGAKRGRKAKATSSGSKVAAKYKDPVSGATWSGRGREPIWMKGKDRAKYAL